LLLREALRAGTHLHFGRATGSVRVEVERRPCVQFPIPIRQTYMSVVERSQVEQRFVLGEVDWQGYQALLATIGEGHTRLTYDRGRLELMSPSPRHERLSRLIHEMICIVTADLGVPRASVGSATWNREDVDRGLEADEAYYIRHEPAVRGKEEIDLSVDPPPDLAVEIEVSRSAVDRLGIYARLQILEVWRYDGTSLRILELQGDGTYRDRPRSPNLPQLSRDDLSMLLDLRHSLDETSWSNEVRRWVRENLLGGTSHAGG
jgi:Uma2 family endonuclease